jgi:small subunit ribosomal protein S8
MTIDRVSNMLSSIKNAVKSQKSYIEIVYTKECEEILKVFKTKGFINDYKIFKPEGKAFRMLKIMFSYESTDLILDTIKQISKPGRRIYKPATELRSIAAGYGLQIVSTSRGIMSSEEARKKKLGGEVICEVR